jgi:hypothetical protein
MHLPMPTDGCPVMPKCACAVALVDILGLYACGMSGTLPCCSGATGGPEMRAVQSATDKRFRACRGDLAVDPVGRLVMINIGDRSARFCRAAPALLAWMAWNGAIHARRARAPIGSAPNRPR